ncbi:MAG: 50S ribosomal protein L23 [Bacteroidota bacterium]
MSQTSVLIRPIVTEKMSRLMEEGSHYAFEVQKTANKIEIRKAIEAKYPDVRVKAVRTMIVRGKRKSQFTKRGLLRGRKRSYKKAIVTLHEGEIDFYENI